MPLRGLEEDCFSNQYQLVGPCLFFYESLLQKGKGLPLV